MQEIVRGLPSEIELAGAILPQDVLVLARSSDVVSFTAIGDEAAVDAPRSEPVEHGDEPDDA
jgi:hypothetical protein